MAEDQIAKKIESGASEQLESSKVEQELGPEQALENKVEQVGAIEKEKSAPTELQGELTTPPIPSVAQVKTPQQIRDEQIDQILSDGLSDIYLSLSPKKQAEFRVKGEETVKKISGLLSKTKMKVQQVVSLIKRWLSIIPGINKFFLEQEAKIKADKVMKLKK